MKALLHWVQNAHRISGDLDIINLEKVMLSNSWTPLCTWHKSERIELANLIQRLRKLLRAHWSQKINVISGSQSSSIISSHLLELMEFPFLIWCGKTTIQMQMETLPTLLTRLYHVHH